MNGSTKPSVAHPLEEEEILDVAAYQTNLDQSLLAARALVESWAPKHLDSSWDAPPQQSMAAALASRLRPPRLGLGASVSAYHVQQAEEKKLRQKMLPNGGRKPKEELLSRSATNLNSDDDDDDEQESRSHAIKKKKDTHPSNSNSIASSSKSLPNPTHSSPVPTPAPLKAKKEVAAISFYGGAEAGDSEETLLAHPSSKNKRKKERDRERAASSKRARLEEVREIEAQRERQGSTSSEDVALPFPSPLLRIVKPPFAPLMSPSMMESSEEERPSFAPQEAPEELDDSDLEAVTPGISVRSEPQENGEGVTTGKKKRRRNKNKNKKGKSEEPLLNLATS